MKLMILVTSALNHNDARMAIRQTWGFYSRHHNVGIGFLVGVYRQSPQNAIIQTEQRRYGDLIQARNVDCYGNLTLKTVSLLEWVDTYCSQVPFVLKTDDDMFINIPLLLTLLKEQQKAKRSIFGRLVSKWRPFRANNSKYFLSKSEYEPDSFPDFLTGPAYLMTQDSVHDLYHQALEMPFLKLEDVFITGYAAVSTGMKRVNVNEFRNERIPFYTVQIRRTISIHEITPKEQFLLWIRTIFKNKATDESFKNNQPLKLLSEYANFSRWHTNETYPAP
ncbi:hypothetical protein V9T40_002784 [Parthenolecanium corni]|uniref:Hexosyltransferase n=1 Tax=Parthenolecanium corni TaxID=536013 RepID=A0AAN9TXI5_9HEMI